MNTYTSVKRLWSATLERRLTDDLLTGRYRRLIVLAFTVSCLWKWGQCCELKILQDLNQKYFKSFDEIRSSLPSLPAVLFWPGCLSDYLEWVKVNMNFAVQISAPANDGKRSVFWRNGPSLGCLHTHKHNLITRDTCVYSVLCTCEKQLRWKDLTRCKYLISNLCSGKAVDGRCVFFRC